jgi:transcriptional regulator with XRE-family HTH domain
MTVLPDTVDMDHDQIEMDLSQIDKDILDILEEGRCTRKHLADRLDVTGQYIYERVSILIRLGVVEKIHDGFYELAEDLEVDEDQSSAEPEEEDSRAVEGDQSTDLPPVLEERLDEYRATMEANGDRRADDRVAAARAIMEMMISEDGVQKSDAVDGLLPEYAVDGQNETTWWRKNGKDLLGEVAEWDQSQNKYVFRD